MFHLTFQRRPVWKTQLVATKIEAGSVDEAVRTLRVVLGDDSPAQARQYEIKHDGASVDAPGAFTAEAKEPVGFSPPAQLADEAS